MNVLVEVALIAVPVPLLAIVRDFWVRGRVERAEAEARKDRIEKERLDRQQAADLAVLASLPGYIELEEHSAQRENIALVRENQAQQTEIDGLNAQIAGLLGTIARQARDLLDKTTEN